MLTRESILAMKPGRELDRLVAERVMGWVVNSEWSYYQPDEDKTVPSQFHKFSLDISASWQAENKIMEKARNINPSIQNMCADYAENLRTVIQGERNYCTVFMLIHATPLQRSKAALLTTIREDTDK